MNQVTKTQRFRTRLTAMDDDTFAAFIAEALRRMQDPATDEELSDEQLALIDFGMLSRGFHTVRGTRGLLAHYKKSGFPPLVPELEECLRLASLAAQEVSR